MLENLDKIDWSKLRHAYGPAGDVPGLLRDLASPNENKRSDAMDELYGNIWHQGTVYEATAYAVPFLLELLESPKVGDKDELLILLANFAKGHSYHDVHQHVSFLKEKAKGKEWQDKIQKELWWVGKVKAAVKAGENVYLGFLNDADARMRDNAAYLLASLERPSAKLAEAVWKRLEKEKQECVQASLVLGFGMLAEHTEANLSSLLAMLVGSSSKPAKLAAAMSLARISPAEKSGEIVAILVDAARSPEDYKAMTESIWIDGNLTHYITGHLTRLEGNAARAAENALTSMVLERPHHEALRIVEFLLTMAFRESTRGCVSFASLDERQQRIVKLFADNRNLWMEPVGRDEKNSVRASVLMQSCGLPEEQAKLQAYVQGAAMPPSSGIDEQKRPGFGERLKNFFGV